MVDVTPTPGLGFAARAVIVRVLGWSHPPFDAQHHGWCDGCNREIRRGQQLRWRHARRGPSGREYRHARTACLLTRSRARRGTP